MGKDKGQRTKGNLQPSSSGRAAQLVTRDGTVSFTGFDGLGGGGMAQLGYIPLAAGGREDVETPMDPEFRMVMRKLTKRDAVTKLKAVQEFTEMCKNSPADTVERVLPFWPRTYNRLAMDTDHRVREATQVAMEQLVSRVHRNLAPHLKSVIGVWLCAQYDSYAPVASAAIHSFHAAFNKDKRAEVVVFCRKELVEFLQANLLTHTADSLSDPKIVPEEERIAKYHRTVSSSLHTLGHVIHVLTPELNLQLQETYRLIFQHKKLWKFSKHKSPHIRGALFALVATCCQKLPDIMISLQTQVSPVILGSLDDSDPAVSRHLWDAVLSVLQCIKDCWNHVNIRKGVLPKLWLLLRSGGNGSASVIYPSLLPLVSCIPTEVIGTDGGFYKEFFSNLREGLHQEKVTSSRKECEAIVSAFMECLRFFLLNQGISSGEGSFSNERQQFLINEQLLPLVRFSLANRNKSWSSSFYTQLANFLSFFTITPNTSSDSDENKSTENEEKPANRQILDYFWQGCTSMCLTCVQSEMNATLVESVAHFLVCLKNPAQKRMHKVLFLEDELPGNTVNGNENSYTQEEHLLPSSWTKVTKPYREYLLHLVCEISTVCLTEIVRHSSSLHLKLLSKLTQPFICEELIRALLVRKKSIAPSDSLHCEGSESFEGLCISTVDFILLPLVQNDGCIAWDNSECISYVTDIIYDVIAQMSVENQVQNLNKALEVNDRVAFFCALVEKGCQKNLVSLLPWLQESLAKTRVCSIAKSLLVPDSTASGFTTTPRSDVERNSAWRILELCLSSQREPLLDDATTEIILQFFLDFLRHLKQDHTRKEDSLLLLTILQSFAKLFETNTKDVPSCLADILLSAFELHLSQSISSEVSEALVKTWEVGLNLASCRPNERELESLEFVLISRASQLVMKNILKCDDLKGIEELAKAAVQLTQSISGNSELHSVVMETIFPTDEEFSTWRKATSEALWEVQPILDQRLPRVTSINKDLATCEVPTVLTEHQKMVSFLAFTIKIFTNIGTNIDDVIRLVLEIMWLQHWCLCLSGLGYSWDSRVAWRQIAGSSKRHSLVMQCYSSLDECISIIVKHLKDNEQANQLINEAVIRSRLHGNIWALVLSGVLHLFKESDIAVDTQLLLSNVQGLASGDECTCQTLVSLVQSIQTIYDLKMLQEQYSCLLRQEKDDTGMAMSLSVVAACLRQWSLLTSGSEEAVMEYQLTLVDVLDEMIKHKNSRQDLLLFSCPTRELPMTLVSFNCILSHLMELAITHSATHLKSDHWDFILCSLASWLQMCDESSSSITASVSGLLLCHAVCRLHSLVVKFFSTTAQTLPVTSAVNPTDTSVNDPDDRSVTALGSGPSGLPPNLLAEWEEFFSGTLCTAALDLFLYHSAKLKAAEPATITLPMVRLAECLGQAVVEIPLSFLKEYQMESGLRDGVNEAVTNNAWSQYTLRRFLPYLDCHVHSLQLASYNILMRTMPEVKSAEPSDANGSELQEDMRSPPSELMVILENASHPMMGILSDAHVPFGECLCMAMDVEARDTCLTLMLSWKLLLTFFRSTSQELRAEYAAFLRQTKAVANLLDMLFRLIPLTKERSIVKEDLIVDVEESVQEEWLHELCCSVYYDLLQWMPAMVRQWWNGLDKRRATVVDKFTASFITPILCQQEMQLVQNSSRRFDNMIVKARPSAREVAAVYTVDEISMELVVKLAPNHPLGVVTVESGRKVGVTSGQWRSWMLQMTTFLTHQNGSIMDGLILWKRNVDKRFEGVDDCMICFSVIHASNYSLPKLTCKTCKKKFHSICLYRWFSTSNNSTCPLCRNLF